MYVAMYVARFCTHSFSCYFPDSALNMHLRVLRICSYTSYKPLPWYFLKQGIRRYSICECFGGCHFATFTHHIHPSPQSFYGHLPFTETQVGGLHKPPLSEHGSPMLHDLHNKWPCQPEVGICIVFAPQNQWKPVKIIGTIWINSVFMVIYPTRPAGAKKAFSPTFMRCTASHAVGRWFLLNFPPDTGKPPLPKGISHSFSWFSIDFPMFLWCEWLACLMCSARDPSLPHSRTKTVVQVHRNFHVILRVAEARLRQVKVSKKNHLRPTGFSILQIQTFEFFIVFLLKNPNFGFDKFGMWLGVQPRSFPSIPSGNIRESSAPASPSWQDVGHLLDWRSRRLDPQSCWDVPQTSVASRLDWWSYPSWNHGYDPGWNIPGVMLEIALENKLSETRLAKTAAGFQV